MNAEDGNPAGDPVRSETVTYLEPDIVAARAILAAAGAGG